MNEYLDAVVERLRDLHVEGPNGGGCLTCDPEQFCRPYPCPTRQGIDELAELAAGERVRTRHTTNEETT